jgi:hypothetical protein
MLEGKWGRSRCDTDLLQGAQIVVCPRFTLTRGPNRGLSPVYSPVYSRFTDAPVQFLKPESSDNLLGGGTG